MSIEAWNWVIGSKVGDSTRKWVLAGYANHAHADGTHAFVGKQQIAEYAECSKRTVQRHVDILLAEGWMREGDQSLVASIRADRRPVVYELAMSEERRLQWAAEYAAHERGDKMTPRDEGLRGDMVLSPREGYGVTDGVTPVTERGDKAVSPEPSVTLEPPVVGEVPKSSRGATPVESPPKATTIPATAPPGRTPGRPVGWDEFGPLTPTCLEHPGGTSAPCSKCADWRPRFEEAEPKRKAARRRALSEAEFAADRSVAAQAASAEALAAREAFREARRQAKAREAAAASDQEDDRCLMMSV